MDSAVKALTGLAIALSEVLFAGLVLHTLTPSLKDQSARLNSDADKRGAREFADALTRARMRLGEVRGSRLALSAYRRKLHELDSGLAYISARSTAGGADPTAVELAPGDLTEMAHFLALAAERIGSTTDLANELREAQLATNLVQTTEAAYDHGALRTLIFTGNLIRRHFDSGDDGSVSVAAFGAAILSDIYRCIPSGDELLQELRSTYPKLDPDEALAAVELDPSDLVGTTFASAAAELGRRPQVLFVQS